MKRQHIDPPPTDRRSQPRIYLPFAAKVRGRDSAGEIFKTETKIDSLSVNGLHVHLLVEPVIGSDMLVAIRLSPAGTIAVRGKVLRCEPETDGTWGVALTFSHYRLIGPEAPGSPLGQ